MVLSFSNIVILIQDQIRRGGRFLFEHPAYATSWLIKELSDLRKSPETIEAISHQCMFGLRSPKPEAIHMRKATRFLVDSRSQHLQSLLDVKCNKGHTHVSIDGSVGGHSRSKAAQTWTDKLCRTILQGFDSDYHGNGIYICGTHASYGATDGDSNENIHGDQETIHGGIDSDEEGDEVFDQSKAAMARDPILKALYKIHQSLGHPQNDDLVRFLKAGNANEAAIKKAKTLLCTTCERRRYPKKQRAVALSPPRAFCDTVGVDCIKIKHWYKHDQLVLNIVDWATGLQQVIPLREETPQACRKAYRDNWVQHYSKANVLVCDGHGSFRGDFAQRARLEGSRIYRIPTEAPWQNARTERRGGVWKVAFEAVIDEICPKDDEEFYECMTQTTLAMNDLGRRRGYSPNQMVFGKSPVLPGNLLELDPENDIHIHSQAESAHDLVERTLEIRTTARTHVLAQENNRKLRRALIAAPRPVREFLVGDIVFVWRRAGYYKNQKRPKLPHSMMDLLLLLLSMVIVQFG